MNEGNGYFLPGWGWGLLAAITVGAAVLLALPESGPRPKSKGWKDYIPEPRPIYRHGYKRIKFWPSVDRARALADEARTRIEQGDRTGAQAALQEARTALKVASYYAEGPHTEAILRERYSRVNELEMAVT